MADGTVPTGKSRDGRMTWLQVRQQHPALASRDYRLSYFQSSTVIHAVPMSCSQLCRHGHESARNARGLCSSARCERAPDLGGPAPGVRRPRLRLRPVDAALGKAILASLRLLGSLECPGLSGLQRRAWSSFSFDSSACL